MTGIAIDSRRLWSRLMDMAEIGEVPGGGSHRLALSQDDIDGRELFLTWCENRGYLVVNDKIANLFVRRPGRNNALPPMVMGSHLDTQPNGGRFDGMLGVLAALEVLETLDDCAIETDRPVEIAVWTNEEGARFQPAMMGSAVHCGVADLYQMLAVRDANGTSVREELEKHGYLYGLAPGVHEIATYVELHIEQGPVLEAEGKVIGAVTGGQSIRWYEVTVSGLEAHAGPMPMAMRRDPIPVLARIFDLAYDIGATDTDARCTIGKIQAAPGSINVMPGRVTLTVDLRHPDDSVLSDMGGRLLRGLALLDVPEGVRLAAEQTWHSPAVKFDPDLVAQIRESALSRYYPMRDLVSGAGHDAFHLSRLVPSAMIFIPCRGGISHNPAEFADPDHVMAGANVLLDLVLAGARVKRDVEGMTM